MKVYNRSSYFSLLPPALRNATLSFKVSACSLNRIKQSRSVQLHVLHGRAKFSCLYDAQGTCYTSSSTRSVPPTAGRLASRQLLTVHASKRSKNKEHTHGKELWRQRKNMEHTGPQRDVHKLGQISDEEDNSKVRADCLLPCYAQICIFARSATFHRANRKFWQWVEADRVKREVSPHID